MATPINYTFHITGSKWFWAENKQSLADSFCKIYFEVCAKKHSLNGMPQGLGGDF